MNKGSSGIRITIVLALLAIAGLSGGVFLRQFVEKQRPVTSQPAVVKETSQAQSQPKTPEVTGPVDCGTYKPTGGTYSATPSISDQPGEVTENSLTTSPEGSKAQACFNDNFKACSPAKLVSELPFFGGAVLKYSREITGLKDSVCEVEEQWIQNPNPNLIGPVKTCRYQPADDFNKMLEGLSAQQLIDSCSGPLAELEAVQ